MKDLEGMIATRHLQPPLPTPPINCLHPLTFFNFKKLTPLTFQNHIPCSSHFSPPKALETPEFFDYLPMEGSGFGASKMGFGWMLTIPVVLWGLTASAQDNEEITDRCNLDLSSFIPNPYNDTSKMDCKQVWDTYVLQYSQSKDHTVNILLSAAYTTGWVGMAFSKDGKMINSSAMVAWVNTEGQPHIRQYYLRGHEPSEVIPEKGYLPLTNVPPFVALRGATIYIAFQLKFASRVTVQPLLFAFGSRHPTKHHHLHHHDAKTSILFDFSGGHVSSVQSAPDSSGHMMRSHGVLGLLGWGLFLPYGAIAARYFKHHDPLWFYLHVGIQFVGFILGLAAVVVGVSLYSRLHAHFPVHRGIGIFILVLSILQILAFFARPDKDSKTRKYWNLYHHWAGRLALFFGNVNIVLGIQMADAGNGWKAGYGFLLGTVLLASIVLEVLSRRAGKKDISPAFQMNSV